MRHSGECIFTTRRPPSRGRSRANDPCRKAVQRRFAAADHPFADRLDIGLFRHRRPRPERAEPARRCAFPQGTVGRERPPRVGGMEVHIPALPDATPGIEIGGSLRPRPPVPARRSRPGGRGATQIRTTTCQVADMHVRIAVQRTCTPVSHVRFRIGVGPCPTAVKSRLQRGGAHAIPIRHLDEPPEATPEPTHFPDCLVVHAPGQDLFCAVHQRARRTGNATARRGTRHIGNSLFQPGDEPEVGEF